MIIIYFILILILLAYHCSYSYREDMVFDIGNETMGFFSSWDPEPKWNSAQCPYGYYLYGLAADHGCGADGGNNLEFWIMCARPKSIINYNNESANAAR